MDTAINFDYYNFPYNEMKKTFSFINERKILKVFLLRYLHKLFIEVFQKNIQLVYRENSLECYEMDSKIIQFLIQDIVETGEYTLEGIAYYTRIPFDVIYDAACGICNHFSITPWVRVVDLYIKVKPDVEQILLERLLEMKSKNRTAFSFLLDEKK